jgi:hypothetical protein
MDGPKWLDDSVKAGRAIDLGGNGYPCRYAAAAQQLVPRLMDEPPEANKYWVCGPNDILLDGWEGKTVIDRAALADARLPSGCSSWRGTRAEGGRATRCRSQQSTTIGGM